MNYLLVIMFYMGSPAEPPVFMDGFLPITFEAYEECEDRRQHAEAYFNSIVGPPFTLACYERQLPGDDT